MRARTCAGQDPGPPLRGTARTDAPRPGRIPPTPLPVPPSDATALAFCTPRPPAKPGPSPGGVPGGEQHHCPGPVRAVKSLDSDCPRDPLRPDCPGPLTVAGSRGARPAAASAAARRPLALGQPRACQAHPLASLVPTRGPPEHPSAAAPASSDDAPPCVFGLRPKTRTRPRPASGRKK